MFIVLSYLLFFLAFVFAGWAVWFVVEFVRYLASGEYEIDQRLRQLDK
jgi:hypothetical protein